MLSRNTTSADAVASITLTLVDPLNNEEVWTREFPMRTFAHFQSQDRLVLLQPEGEFSELNLRTGEMHKLGTVDPKLLSSQKSIYSFRDNENAYLILNQRSTASTRLHSSNGVHGVRISGLILAYDLNTGELRWPPYQVKKTQNLLLSSLNYSPVLLLTSGKKEIVGRRPTTTIRKLTLRALNKQTGKPVLEATIPMRPELQTVRVSPAGKYIELWTYNERVRLMPMQSETASVESVPAEAANSPSK